MHFQDPSLVHSLLGFVTGGKSEVVRRKGIIVLLVTTSNFSFLQWSLEVSESLPPFGLWRLLLHFPELLRAASPARSQNQRHWPLVHTPGSSTTLSSFVLPVKKWLIISGLLHFPFFCSFNFITFVLPISCTKFLQFQ